MHGNTPTQKLAIIWNPVHTDVVQKCWKYVNEVATFNIKKKRKQHNVVWKSSGQYGWNFTAGLYQLELMSDSRALSHFPPSHCQQPAEHLLSKIHPTNYALILEAPVSARLQLRLSRLLQRWTNEIANGDVVSCKASFFNTAGPTGLFHLHIKAGHWLWPSFHYTRVIILHVNSPEQNVYHAFVSQRVADLVAVNMV